MSKKMAYVEAIHNHYDKLVGETRYPGERYTVALDSAERRERRDLVEILEVHDQGQEKEGAPQNKAETGAPENKDLTSPQSTSSEGDVAPVPTDEELSLDGDDTDEKEEEEEEEEEEFDWEDYVKDQRGPFYYIEGHDDNPVQGKDPAREIVEKLHK